MNKTYPSKEIEDESLRLASIWVKDGGSLDSIVEKYASDSYKDYYQKEKDRKQRLFEAGIIEE